MLATMGRGTAARHTKAVAGCRLVCNSKPQACVASLALGGAEEALVSR